MKESKLNKKKKYEKVVVIEELTKNLSLLNELFIFMFLQPFQFLFVPFQGPFYIQDQSLLAKNWLNIVN
jgi:hypothetical protein